MLQYMVSPRTNLSCGGASLVVNLSHATLLIKYFMD